MFSCLLPDDLMDSQSFSNACLLVWRLIYCLLVWLNSLLMANLRPKLGDNCHNYLKMK